MNKADLISLVHTQSELTKTQATEIVENVFRAIGDSLAAGQKVSLAGFGTFEIKTRASRVGRNPRTGEPVEIAASNAIKFKPFSALKDVV